MQTPASAGPVLPASVRGSCGTALALEGGLRWRLCTVPWRLDPWTFSLTSITAGRVLAGHGQQGAPMLTVGKAALALERRATG